MARKDGRPRVTPDLSRQGMTKSGFCQFGPSASHAYCSGKMCDCSCHDSQDEPNDN